MSSPKRELLRKLTVQEPILMDDNDSVDQEFIKDVFTRFKNNLISIMEISRIRNKFENRKNFLHVSSMN